MISIAIISSIAILLLNSYRGNFRFRPALSSSDERFLGKARFRYRLQY